MEKEYNLSRDPVYFAMVGFFALLTTGFPLVLGQFRFLPLVQALALAIFLLVPLRRRDLAKSVPDAPKILQGNVYGWFERVEKGIYGLTS